MAESISRASTRERLLDAAEELLLQYDYDAVSVRSICAHSQANPAAVHYHFGSKEQLVAALLETRLAPVWAAGLDRIDQQPATVTALVDALWAPMDELLADPVGTLRLSLLARFVLSHPNVRWQSTWFDLTAWVRALQRARPELDETTARYRCRFAFSALLTQVGGGHPLPPAAAAALRAFLVAGLAGTPAT
ncbi:TetR/AcrR family transcriptional regulator [Gordonia alkaliphila]|uniref:TetR/AcrR family transcriptional regulator n=1 Tax=Gordonia alkaliphila TaxID=1053547 RepID=A0ABP8ZG65_9ACTN|nr:TetR/AcrR family transcriptional regulator [Gordonia alkaliphila]MCK0438710.1 TetR/AcrR family transcriptional regulator [Gordonia alkaliphila]